MKFLEFQEEAKKIISESCRDEGYGEVDPEVALPPSPEYGDLSSALPIRLARSRSVKPGEVAVKVAAKAGDLARETRYVGAVSPHRSGYLNFTINYPNFIFDSINDVLMKGNLGSKPGVGRTVAIEHTNVNPNKALHIGHARNLVLGDSLCRILQYLGDRVQALNYIDDSGAQVADIIVGFKFLAIPDSPPPGVKFDAYCGDRVYAKVNQEYERDPKLKERQSLVLKEIENGKGELAEYTRGVVRRILADQLATCWRLGAAYDLLNWESHLVHSGLWESIFEKMKMNGLVKYETKGENKGCWVIPDPETGEQKVVVRSDGTIVYVAKDIPYAAWKIGLLKDPFQYEAYTEAQPGGGKLYTTVVNGHKSEVKFGGADLAVSVIDTRQSYLQRIVGKVLERIQKGASERYLHRAYEVVALSKRTATQLGFEIEGEFAHMSGRKGLFVNVDSVLDVLREKAKSETRRRNQHETQGWVDDVAEALAVGALRYELVKQDPDKLIVFDLEDSLGFEGDTGPYLMYTYARARRIIEKTTGHPQVDIRSAAKLTRPQEKKLVKALSSLDLSAAKAGVYLSPKEVARFAHDLSFAFNDFYETVQVNREEDVELRDARLALVDASSRVLAESMRLLGIPTRNRI